MLQHQKKFKRKVITSVLIGTTLASFVISSAMGEVYANEQSSLKADVSEYIGDSILVNESEKTNRANTSEFEKFNQYVQVEDDRFVLFLPNEVNFQLEEIEKVRSIITATNSQIELAKKDMSTDVYISTIEQTNLVKPALMRANGVNKVDFYWNYARVFLSKNTLFGLGAGATVAGVYISAGTASAVVALLGYGLGGAPSGIWFDYNYFIGVLCGNYGWQ